MFHHMSIKMTYLFIFVGNCAINQSIWPVYHIRWHVFFIMMLWCIETILALLFYPCKTWWTIIIAILQKWLYLKRMKSQIRAITGGSKCWWHQHQASGMAGFWVYTENMFLEETDRMNEVLKNEWSTLVL